MPRGHMAHADVKGESEDPPSADGSPLGRRADHPRCRVKVEPCGLPPRTASFSLCARAKSKAAATSLDARQRGPAVDDRAEAAALSVTIGVVRRDAWGGPSTSTILETVGSRGASPRPTQATAASSLAGSQVIVLPMPRPGQSRVRRDPPYPRHRHRDSATFEMPSSLQLVHASWGLPLNRINAPRLRSMPRHPARSTRHRPTVGRSVARGRARTRQRSQEPRTATLRLP